MDWVTHRKRGRTLRGTGRLRKTGRENKAAVVVTVMGCGWGFVKESALWTEVRVAMEIAMGMGMGLFEMESVIAVPLAMVDCTERVDLGVAVALEDFG